MTKEQFLKDVGNWSSHRYLLWEALEKTAGEVVEMGCGDGSTPFLRKYCYDAKRMLYSYDNNEEWWRRMQDYHGEGHHVILVKDWDEVHKKHLHPSVVLIDSAPGERRQIDLKLFADKASIIVLHDTEPAADHGYQMRQHIPMFKWWRDHEVWYNDENGKRKQGAWASIASNFVEV